MENKKWYKSLTIIAQIVIIVCVILQVGILLAVKPLRYEFTPEELCDWAYAVSHIQRLMIVQMIIISAALTGIYGRKRAGGIGK